MNDRLALEAGMVGDGLTLEAEIIGDGLILEARVLAMCWRWKHERWAID